MFDCKDLKYVHLCPEASDADEQMNGLDVESINESFSHQMLTG
jgi:hypothetical protein